MQYDDGVDTPQSIAIVNRFRTITTKRPAAIRQAILTTPTALALGGAAGLGGTLVIINLDPNNYVTVYNATGDKAIARLDPDTDSDGHGGFLVIDRLGADSLVPYGVANTATCEVMIFACPP